MLLLKIEGVKKALEYIQKNGRSLKCHKHDPQKGMIILPEGTPEDEAYHIYLAQKIQPSLIMKVNDRSIILSPAGQELYDILCDEKYLAKLKEHFISRGFSGATDRQLFRLAMHELTTRDACNEKTANIFISALPSDIKKIKDVTEVKPQITDQSQDAESKKAIKNKV